MPLRALKLVQGGFHAKVVEASSAMGPIDRNKFQEVGRVDHFTIVAPDDPTRAGHILQLVADIKRLSQVGLAFWLAELSAVVVRSNVHCCKECPPRAEIKTSWSTCNWHDNDSWSSAYLATNGQGLHCLASNTLALRLC